MSTGIVVIAASAGGLPALQQVLGDLPPTLPASIVIVQHRSADVSILSSILRRYSPLPVEDVLDAEPLQPGHVYVAPANRHVRVRADHHLESSDGRRIRGVLSSANPLFESAAEIFGTGCIAVVLTGSGFDATDGVQAVKARGGFVIAQDEATSRVFGMPRSAIETGAVNAVLPIDAIGGAIAAAVAERTTAT
jgi:two-component system chemotaxis response regulator CheB